MGCGSTKNTLKAIGDEFQPIPALSLTQSKTNLPSEVMLGFEKILKTASVTPQGPVTERIKPENKGEVLLSPGQMGKTGHDITPADRPATVNSKSKDEAENGLNQVTDLLADQSEQRLEKVKTLYEAEPERKSVPEAEPVLPPIEEQSEAMLNAYMEQPVTNPYLELMRTQEQGKVPIEEVSIDSQLPPATPKAAFAEDQAIPAIN